jgi:hypothetical protein
MAFVGTDVTMVLEKEQGTVRRIINNSMLEKSVLNVNVNPGKKVCMCGKWEISVIGDRIMISINGTTIMNFLFRSMSERLSRGSIGLYTEDAEVSFDDIFLTNLTKTRIIIRDTIIKIL